MRTNTLLIAAALGGILATTAVIAPTVSAQEPDTKRVRISYQNLTTGQGFAPSVFMSHNAAAPKLYAMGGRASFGLAQLAETGNGGPVAGVGGKMAGKAGGKPAIGLPTMPGATGYVDVEVSAKHPNGVGRVDARHDQ